VEDLGRDDWVRVDMMMGRICAERGI
jgi:hypothetical protein